MDKRFVRLPPAEYCCWKCGEGAVSLQDLPGGWYIEWNEEAAEFDHLCMECFEGLFSEI